MGKLREKNKTVLVFREKPNVAKIVAEALDENCGSEKIMVNHCF